MTNYQSEVIAGIDTGLKYNGVAYSEGFCEIIALKGDNRFKDLATLRRELVEHFRLFNVKYVGIEDMLYSIDSKRSWDMGVLMGVCLMAVADTGINGLLIHPSRLKTFAKFSMDPPLKSLQKRDIVAIAKNVYGADFGAIDRNHHTHVADATILMKMVQVALNGEYENLDPQVVKIFRNDSKTGLLDASRFRIGDWA